MSILSTIDAITIEIVDNLGKTTDITNIFLELDIFESVFDNFLHGKLLLNDTIDLIGNLPIIGNEVIQITINTIQSDDPIILDFVIYKLDKDLSVRDNFIKNRMFIAYICSKELINNHLYKFNRKFSDTGDTNIQWMLDNPLASSKTLTSTATDSSINFISNFWDSKKAIDYICKTSKTSEYSDFIFFENLTGFVFKPISELMMGNSIEDLVYSNSPDTFMQLNIIKTFMMNAYFDFLSLAKVGFFGGTFFNYDDTTYSYTKTESMLSENQELITSLGKNSMFPDDMSQYSNNFKTKYLDHDISATRMTQLKLMNQYNLVLNMNGDFIRSVGNLVNFSYPNIDNENFVNDQLDGLWFINSIKHKFFQNNIFQQNVLLSKNAAFNNSELESITLLKNV